MAAPIAVLGAMAVRQMAVRALGGGVRGALAGAFSIRTRSRVDIQPLLRLARSTRRAGRGVSGGSDPFRAVFKQWAARYSAYTRRRFNRLSRGGGGEWKPLAPSTVARRRKGRKSSRTASRSRGRRAGTTTLGGAQILTDTGTLKRALTIGAQGNLVKFIKGGVRYGFNDARHPNAKRATLAQIAGFHNTGGRRGRPPRRVILAEPDATTRLGMMRDLQRGIRRAAGR